MLAPTAGQSLAAGGGGAGSRPRRSVWPRLPQGLQSGLVDDIEQVLGVHGQGVRGRQHLLLVLLLQAGHDILLGQLHLVDELPQVGVQQLLGHLNLQGQEGQERLLQPTLRAFLGAFLRCLQEQKLSYFPLNKADPGLHLQAHRLSTAPASRPSSATQEMVQGCHQTLAPL